MSESRVEFPKDSSNLIEDLQKSTAVNDSDFLHGNLEHTSVHANKEVSCNNVLLYPWCMYTLEAEHAS